jgi:hypothetical protein
MIVVCSISILAVGLSLVLVGLHTTFWGLLPERHSLLRQTKYSSKRTIEFQMFSQSLSPVYGSKPDVVCCCFEL